MPKFALKHINKWPKRKTTKIKLLSPAEAAPQLILIDSRLKVRYGVSRLGNPSDPLDDLIFIILSSRTRGIVYQEIFGLIKRKYSSWDRILKIGPDDLEKHLRRGGLSRKKAGQIYQILSILKERCGEVSLDVLNEMSDGEAEKFLINLPGIGLKTARCVLMYALGRQVFPVDAHIIRILSYFGLINSNIRPEYAQDALQNIVPKGLRYSLHVNLVTHGRETCIPGHPLCGRCVLRDICPMAQIFEDARTARNRTLSKQVACDSNYFN